MQAIDNLDEGVLHADLLPQLVAIVPEKPELQQVKESIDACGGYEEVRARLGAAETFYMELHRVQRVHAKVKVLQFKQEFVGDLADIEVPLSMRFAAYQCQHSAQVAVTFPYRAHAW